MSQVKELAANTGVTLICNDTGDCYAQIKSGNLTGDVTGTLPTGFTYSEKSKFSVEMEYTLNDGDIKTDGDGIAYWGVESRRRK